jgi:hypothetical protein
MDKSSIIIKQRLLYIGVGFRNYDELIVKELSKRYDVVYINSKDYDQHHRVLYKIARKYSKIWLEKLCARNIMREIREKAVNINKIFVIKGEHLTKEHLDYILKHNKIERKVLYLWDKWSAHENIDEIRPFFNDIFSFDTRDCEEKGLKLRPLFYFKDQIKISQRKTIDVAFVGNDHTGRYELLKRVKKLCLSNGLSYKFCLLVGKIEYTKMTRFPFLKSKYSRNDAEMFSESGVSYEEYVDIISSSNVVLDIPFEGQSGLTMRTIETLAMGKKIITTNATIKEYLDIPQEMYLIIDEKLNEKEFLDFINNNTNTSPLPKRYSVSNALEEMIAL